MRGWKVSVPGTYLERNEVLSIIDAVSQVSRHIERDQLLLRTMWETGGRVSEVIQLGYHQIIEADLAVILRNLKREEVEYKKPYISQRLIEALLTFCEVHRITGEDYVFPANRLYVWRLVTKAAKYANVYKPNLTRGRMVPAWPHLFRHACAMEILSKTGRTEKAQRQLGHSSIITTQVYATLSLEKSDREISDIW